MRVWQFFGFLAANAATACSHTHQLCLLLIRRLNLRQEDLGILWEHIVLNELQGKMQTKEIRYWRDKQHHELDFILLPTQNAQSVAIECKWKSAGFDPANLKIFRQYYPGGSNFVVASDVDITYQRQYGKLKVSFIGLSQLLDSLI